MSDASFAAPRIGVPVELVRRQVALLGLLGLMFFTVSGGAYGLEDMVSLSGPGMAILLLIVTPIIWSVTAALMVAELGTALPVEGGYYQWVKVGLGRYCAYQEGFWSWLTTWVDMAIYPVLFADYLALTYWSDANAGAVVFFELGPRNQLHEQWRGSRTLLCCGVRGLPSSVHSIRHRRSANAGACIWRRHGPSSSKRLERSPRRRSPS